MGYIYMYGQIISTESFLLEGDFPQADGYGEIAEKHHLIGGETGTAAFILAHLGCPLVLGGTHLGHNNKEIILGAFKGTDTDTSALEYEDFPGITDYVIIDKNTRTCFGEWKKHYSRPAPFFSRPDEDSLKNADIVAADPYFGDEAAKLCRKYGKKLVTIDSAYDSVSHRNSAVDVISHQHLRSEYPHLSADELFKLYTDNSDGLTIFTFGECDLTSNTRK